MKEKVSLLLTIVGSLAIVVPWGLYFAGWAAGPERQAVLYLLVFMAFLYGTGEVTCAMGHKFLFFLIGASCIGIFFFVSSSLPSESGIIINGVGTPTLGKLWVGHWPYLIIGSVFLLKMFLPGLVEAMVRGSDDE